MAPWPNSPTSRLRNRSSSLRDRAPVAAFTHPALPQVEVKLDASAGAGFSILEYIVPSRFSPPPVLHRHTKESATGYIASGRLTYWFADGPARAAEAGTVVHLPAGAWFRWANETDDPVRMLFVFRPAGFEQFFLELMEAVAERGGEPSAIGHVIFRFREKYGDEQYPS